MTICVNERRYLYCSDGEAVDWTFAHMELLQKQGIDLHNEMETRSEAVTSSYVSFDIDRFQ